MARSTSIALSLVATAALAGASCSSRDPGPAPGPTLVSDPADEGCPHALMPLVEGARWEYLLGAPDSHRRTKAELRVTRITTKGAAIEADVLRHVGASRTKVRAVCRREGTSFLAMFVPLGPPLPVELGFAPRVTKRTGALLPPVKSLRSGHEWVQDLVAHTENPGGRALTMDSNWNIKARYMGAKSVVVPAGRYDTVQIGYLVTVHHRPPAEEDVVFDDRVMDPPPMEFIYSFARGVGVVKIEGALGGADVTKRMQWELAKVSRGGGS